MESLVYKALSICERNLINEDHTILAHTDDVSAAWACRHRHNFPAVHVQALLDDVIEWRVENFDAPILRTSDHSWNVPLRCEPLQSAHSESQAEQLLGLFLLHFKFSDDWLAALEAGSQD